jgi:DNA repair protein RadD
MLKLRSYQNDCVVSIRECFTNKIKSVLTVLPTGGGKTVIFTYISQQSALKNKRVMILVHRVELLNQTSKALNNFDVEHGLINPKYTPNFNASVQVASVQTLIKRLGYLSAVNWEPDIIVVDEAHHATAGSWRKIINHFPNSKVLGVTATPIRSDGQGLGIQCGGLFDELIEGPTMPWLMDQGFLVRPRIFGTPEALDFSNVNNSMGDYAKNDLSNMLDKPTIIGSAVDHYRELCPNTPAIVFCVSVAHAEHTAQEFRNSGFKFYSIDGNTDDDLRKQLIDALTTGSIDGLTSCDLIGEGTDIPRATTAIELRPTQSKGLNLQQRGRVLRPVYAPGYDLETKDGRLAAIAASEKPFAFILDHVGNSIRHGLPYDEQEWSLEGEKRKKGGKKQIQSIKVDMCESCFAMYEPAAVCPQCGHVNKVRDTTPKQVEGTLTEITAENLIRKEKRTEQGQAESLEDLKRIAKERGYKTGWANAIYSSRQKKIEKVEAERIKKEEFKNLTEIELQKFTINNFDDDLDF